MSTGPLVGALLLSVLAGGCDAGGCQRTRSAAGGPDLSAVPEAKTLPVAAALDLRLTHLTALSEEAAPGTIALAARRSGGRLIFARLSGSGFQVEEVAPGALPAAPALAIGPSGAPVIAAITAPVIGEHARVAPPPEAPRTGVEGEGALRLLHRRGEGLWRGELLADRALEPRMVAGEGGVLHLVFLQPYARGLFQIVYVRVLAGGVSREVVGLGRRMTPGLAVLAGRPQVAYLDETGRVQVRVGTAGGGFEPTPIIGRELPVALACDLALQGTEVVLGLLAEDGRSTPLVLRALRPFRPVAEAATATRRPGTVPRREAGRLMLAPGARRWAIEGPKGAIVEGPPGVGARRLTGLRQVQVLAPGAGPFGVIGLDAEGLLRVSP